jgi:hypothetical protein
MVSEFHTCGHTIPVLAVSQVCHRFVMGFVPNADLDLTFRLGL